MKRLVAPLRAKMRGRKVADLQTALLSLLKRATLPDDHASPNKASVAVGKERDKQYYGSATQKLVALFQEMHGLQATGEVDERTASAFNAALGETGGAGKMSEFVVRGTIRRVDGSPAPGLKVSAYDCDMRHEELLGTTKTDPQGHYEIRYTRSQFRRAEKERADLVVKISDDNGNEVAVSDIFFSPDYDQTVDLILKPDHYRGPSEYERHVQELAPLIENVPLAKLTDDDLRFLRGETAISAEQLGYLVLDAQWNARHDLDAAVSYGLFRQGLPTSLPPLLSEPPSRLREALKAAIEQNIVPAELGGKAEDIVERLQGLAAKAVFESDEEEGVRPIGVVLDTLPNLDKERQSRLAQFLLRYKAGEEGEGSCEVRRSLQEEVGLDGRTADTVQFSLQSGPFVFGHAPTLRAVQKRQRQEGWIAAQDLARLTRDDWRQLAGETAMESLPSGFDDPRAFADAIAFRVEKAFPSAVVANRLAKDEAVGGPDLTSFFASNPEFDLVHTRIDDFLDNGANLDHVQDAQTLRRRLKDVQRITRVVPMKDAKNAPEGGLYTGVSALLEGGFSSARAIVDHGEAAFINTMTPVMGQASAEMTFAMARERADSAHVMHQRLRDYATETSPVLPHIDTAAEEPADLEALFGSMAACACEHCRSVYGPAAYMAALLKFLDDAPDTSSAEGGSTRPLDVLLGRRPDLKYILLNCANASTALPYIDLVNEILEEAIAPIDPVPMPGDSASPAEREAYGTWLARYQTPERDGVSRDELAARLRAEPAHEHAAAYEQLSTAEFPWVLPFKADQERAWLLAEHLGLKLDQVRALFGHDPNHVAKDFLKISQGEWDLLTRPPGAVDAAETWGVSSLESLEYAPVFMKQAELSYEALRELTETWFLSAEGLARVTLELTDDPDADPCDVAAYRVRGLRNDAVEMDHHLLDQIHRFLRLQHKLGWSVGELDGVLEAFGHAEINADVAKDIARVRRLQRAYRRPVGILLNGGRSALAEVLGITDAEFALFAEVIGAGDVSLLAMSDRLHLLEQWQVFRTSGFDLRELAYILLGWDQVPPAFTPDEGVTRGFLRTLHAFVQARAELSDAPAEQLERLIVENLGRYLNLATDVVDRLVRPVADDAGTVLADALVGAQSDLSAPAVGDFVDFVQIAAGGGEPDEAEPALYSNARLLLIRLDRLARLLRGLRIERRELDAIAAVRTANGFLDFNLVTLAGEPPAALPDPFAAEKFQGWRVLVEAMQTQRALPAAGRDVFDFVREAADGRYAAADLSSADTFAELVADTGWAPDDIAALTNALGLNAEDFQLVATYAKLQQTAQWLRRWRITPETLALWGDPVTPLADLALSLQETARARYPSDGRWYEVLAPISDHLREKKRDALLAYLIHNEGAFDDASDVYAHYLIDPEMSSCQLTSRIKQANASIQLFVQRLLMGLEEHARLTSAAAYWRRWEWLQNYRVCEANRKVFLYPENWIEPELRDDKSPFFRELENELLQDEVTDEAVERAYRNYLDRLDEVGRLDVRGLYHQEEPDVLHVFARTRSAPPRYYYRERDLSTQVWSAWEKVALDIEGEHLIPVAHEGRLLLFWPIFEPVGDVTTDDGSERAFWKMTFAWSEYRYGSWQASNKGLDRPLWTELTGKENFVFKASVDGGQLYIRVYQKHTDGIAMVSSIMRLRFDPCSRTLVNDPADQKLMYLNPVRTEHSGMAFVEIKDAPPVRRINVGSPQERTATPLYAIARAEPDTISISETAEELISEGGLGGVLLGLIVGAVDVASQWASLVASRINVPLLEATPGGFKITPAHQTRQFVGLTPFFVDVAEDGPTYLVTPSEETASVLGLFDISYPSYRFEIFYHPFACRMHRVINADGLEGLFGGADEWPSRQRARESRPVFRSFSPSRAYVSRGYPVEEVDFDLTGAYSVYNWELFFHIPMLLADRLSKNHRFKEAHKWFHYIFDPTDVSSLRAPAKYWKLKPFYEEAQNPPASIRELMRRLAAGDDEMEAQVRAWRANPFNPHLIARLRTLSYMKAVLMKYLDNLIAWGDHLFQQDTIESINEAVQLYILAYEILGKRPTTVQRDQAEDLNYEMLQGRLGDFANVLVDLETHLPADLSGSSSGAEGLPSDLVLYFCIPQNGKLAEYWDKVADRLFKIRHCMNIEGKVRQLPLFEPPIDPALLVRARAAGVDIRDALTEFGAVGLPHYRYAYLNQKALELCGEVRALGSALLSVLEKKDAEEMSLMRTRHEAALLSQVRFVKEQQIKEAEESAASLTVSRKLAEKRLEYYSGREFMNAAEISHLGNLLAAHVFESIGQGYNVSAAFAHLVPDTTVGSPMAAGATFGGSNVGNSLRATAGVFSYIASQHTFAGSMSSLIGGYQRREDDWGLQASLAETELEQLDRQIAAAEIRLAIAEKDLATHEKQMAQNREVEDFLRGKFTNQELYGWMVSQLSALHYQAYRMAYDLAKKAERAAQHELGVRAAEFSHISFGHWDSLKKGLLAGESLQQDLRRMDVAFMAQNRREYEIAKPISLALTAPEQLIRLRETGACDIHLPELLFDLDFPGQFNRRIKSVSITIPCVTGPYTNVSAKLTLRQSYVRSEPAAGSEHLIPEARPRDFSIATSTARADSGLFELNFRDERYLPFEGAGAVSTWGLELSGKWRLDVDEDGELDTVDLSQFDFDTISDVIFQVSYTSREAKDDGSFKATVIRGLQSAINTWLNDMATSGTPLTRLVSLRQEFGSQFEQFLHPRADATHHETQVTVENRHFPYFLRGRELEVQEVLAIVKAKGKADDIRFDGHQLQLARAPLPAADAASAGEALVVDTADSPAWGGLPTASFTLSGPPAGDWALRLDPTGLPAELTVGVGGQPRLNPDVLDDVFLVLRYRVAGASS